MDAPQSWDEVGPIEEAMRRVLNDPFLSIRWNPESYVTCPGHFDVYGAAIAAHYEGRWEVRRDPPNEPSVLVYQVRFDDQTGEPYRAIGWWLIPFLQKWDTDNVHAMEERKRLFDEAEREQEAEDALADEGMREFLNKQAADQYGDRLWIGRGFGRGPRKEQAA